MIKKTINEPKNAHAHTRLSMRTNCFAGVSGISPVSIAAFDSLSDTEFLR